MTKLQDSIREPIDEGWSVHIYDRHRRLLCTLAPSHGWMFLLGCVFGIMVAMLWGNVAQQSPPVQAVNPTTDIPQLRLD